MSVKPGVASNRKALNPNKKGSVGEIVNDFKILHNT